jgi:hypothetical protein
MNFISYNEEGTHENLIKPFKGKLSLLLYSVIIRTFKIEN